MSGHFYRYQLAISSTDLTNKKFYIGQKLCLSVEKYKDGASEGSKDKRTWEVTYLH